MSEQKNNLISLKKVLKHSNKQLRDRWCEQLLYKTYIIHNEFENVDYNVCLKNLKVDSENRLVITNISEKANVAAKVKTDVRFKAPELIDCNKRSKAGDVWATGVCVFYIQNLGFPWKSATKSDENYSSWAEKGTFPRGVNGSNLRILKQMLCVEPEKRPGIKSVIKSMYNDEVDPEVLSKFI